MQPCRTGIPFSWGQLVLALNFLRLEASDFTHFLGGELVGAQSTIPKSLEDKTQHAHVRFHMGE